jgi:hypothetical protein
MNSSAGTPSVWTEENAADSEEAVADAGDGMGKKSTVSHCHEFMLLQAT